MVFPPTNLPGGLIVGVPAITEDEVVRLDQIQGSASATSAPLVPARIAQNLVSIATAGNVRQCVLPFSFVIGDCLIVEASGIMAANANAAKFANIKYNSSIYAQVASDTGGPGFGNAKYWTMRLEIFRQDATNIRTIVNSMSNDQDYANAYTVAVSGGALPQSFVGALIQIELGTNTGDVTCQTFTVDYVPVPIA